MLQKRGSQCITRISSCHTSGGCEYVYELEENAAEGTTSTIRNCKQDSRSHGGGIPHEEPRVVDLQTGCC